MLVWDYTVCMHYLKGVVWLQTSNGIYEYDTYNSEENCLQLIRDKCNPHPPLLYVKQHPVALI